MLNNTTISPPLVCVLYTSGSALSTACFFLPRSTFLYIRSIQKERKNANTVLRTVSAPRLPFDFFLLNFFLLDRISKEKIQAKKNRDEYVHLMAKNMNLKRQNS